LKYAVLLAHDCDEYELMHWASVGPALPVAPAGVNVNDVNVNNGVDGIAAVSVSVVASTLAFPHLFVAVIVTAVVPVVTDAGTTEMTPVVGWSVTPTGNAGDTEYVTAPW